MIVSDGPTKHGKMFKPLTSLLSSALAVAASCPTLRDLFPAEGLYEHNLYDFVVKSSHIVGDRDESQKFAYTDPGDQDLWYDNPLGSYIDGNVTDIVGTSSGVCNLLPPSANASQCLSVFSFQDYGTLVMSSIWPNNIVERGQLIIVGGTKCFENVLGTISALGTDDTWEFWEYHLLNDDNNDCQDANLLEVFNSTYALSPWSSDNDQVVGDRNLWYGNWLLRNNESVSNNADDSLVGLASGACTWLDWDVCIGLETFEFNNGNRITQVMFNVSEQEILGGTDCLLGEKGTVELVDDEFGMYRYSLQPVIKRSDCNDLSLEEILTTGLYEQRATDVVLSASGDTGSGQDVGDTVYWLNNQVSAESVNGTSIGTTSGNCNVLPLDGSASLCLVQLHLKSAVGDASSSGSITFIGLVPNADNASGLMAVVSGTGCFSNPTVKSLNYARKESGNYFTIQSLLDGDESSPNNSAFIYNISLFGIIILCFLSLIVVY